MRRTRSQRKRRTFQLTLGSAEPDTAPTAVLTSDVLQRGLDEAKAMDADDRRDVDGARFWRAKPVTGPSRPLLTRKALP